jgi:signal transduction histidine kinase
MTREKQTAPPDSLALSDKVRAHSRYFESIPELVSVLDAMPTLLIILNNERRVVFVNRYLAEALQLEDRAVVYGLRPGELMDCAHASDAGTPCGTGEVCQACGGNQTIADCRHGQSTTHECRITQLRSGHALDLRVAGTPIQVGGEAFSLLVLTDISHEKRRHALERVFFHDLMNVAAGIVAYASVLSRLPDSQHASEAAQRIRKLVFQLTDEIKAQRELAEAESDELQVFWEPVSSRQILESTIETFREQPLARDRSLVLDPVAADVVFSADRTLLGRVLGNLFKNALEASRPSQQVTGFCEADGDAIEFRVHNPGEMPRDVQLQIFQRSFSTKGRGRGLGTYSIKLLTERYLKGRAWFTSNAQTGTTFHVRYPRRP